MTDPVTITLSRPVQAHGEEITKLEIREPLGVDIRLCGLPFSLAPGTAGGDGEVQIREAAITKYISRLAKVPPTTVDQLAPNDWMTAMGAVLGFFDDAAGTLTSASTMPSTSPGSGA